MHKTKFKNIIDSWTHMNIWLNIYIQRQALLYIPIVFCGNRIAAFFSLNRDLKCDFTCQKFNGACHKFTKSHKGCLVLKQIR